MVAPSVSSSTRQDPIWLTLRGRRRSPRFLDARASAAGLANEMAPPLPPAGITSTVTLLLADRLIVTVLLHLICAAKRVSQQWSRPWGPSMETGVRDSRDWRRDVDDIVDLVVVDEPAGGLHEVCFVNSGDVLAPVVRLPAQADAYQGEQGVENTAALGTHHHGGAHLDLAHVSNRGIVQFPLPRLATSKLKRKESGRSASALPMMPPASSLGAS